MSVIIVLIFGAVSLSKLPLDLLPSIDVAYAAVITDYRGAGPYEVESIITVPLEDVLGTVSNLKNISSSSTEGTSMVMLEFEDGTDMDIATLQMREKIDLIRGFLPEGTGDPLVVKFDPSLQPILYLSVSSDMSHQMLSEHVDNTIKEKIERVAGVASVTVEGKEEREIKIELVPEKLLAYGISQNQIINILQSENNNIPGGNTSYGEKDIIVRTVSKFQSIEDIENLPITLPTGGVIKLGEIGKITESTKPQDSISRLNGQRSVMLSIQKQSTSNAVQVINAIKSEIEKIEETDSSVDISIIFDQAGFIEMVLSTVMSNAVLGGVMAIFILWIFLKNFKMALVIGTAIPISVIATLVLVYFSGITLNMISLGGIALGIGMLVDNAIVVLENIFRYHKLGNNPYDSAVNGTKEITSAVIASTLTSVVVFLPIIFLEGFTAKIFKELAMTVSFSLLASLVVSLTVVPLACYIMLKSEKTSSDSEKLVQTKENTLVDEDGKIINHKLKFVDKLLIKFDKYYAKLENFYGNTLSYALDNRKKIIIISFTIFFATISLLPFMGAEFIPQTDEGKVEISIELPKGTSLENTDLVVKKVEKILMTNENVDKVSTVVGSGSKNTANITGVLKDKGDRKDETFQVAEDVRIQAEKIPGASIKVSQGGFLGMDFGGGSSGVSIELNGNDIQTLNIIANDVEKLIGEVSGVRGISSSLTDGAPELQIKVNKDVAATYGITAAQVGQTIRSLVDGTVATRLTKDGTEIDIRVKAMEEYYSDSEKLKNLIIQTPSGGAVPLNAVAEISLEKGPSVIDRSNKIRTATISSEIYGRDIKSVNEDIQIVLSEYDFPEGYGFALGGQFDMLLDSFSSLSTLFIMAIILVYMVMAMQFESLLYPFIIMFSIPFALSGSIILTFLTNKPISIISFIGVTVLVGIVVNNSIVLVDYINTLRAKGMDKVEAIKKSGQTRLKPILMTALTTILGLIPLFLSTAQGSEMQSSLAAVVIGGLTFSTVLTLVVVPVMYFILDEFQLKMINKYTKK